MSSKAKIIELFKNSDPDFDITKLSISDPFLIEANDLNHNTGVVLKSNGLESGYMGSKTYTYFRISLNELFVRIIPVLDFTDIKTFDDAILAINEKFGLVLSKEDFVENQPTNGKFVLKAKPTNYQYIDSVTFTHALPLDKTKQLTINGFTYPSKVSFIKASIYSRNLPVIDSLYLFNVSATDNVVNPLTAKLLKLASNNNWVVDVNRTEYNLYNAVLKSAIKTTDQGVVTNTLSIVLDSTYCTNMDGELEINVSYNEDDIIPTSTIDYSRYVSNLKQLPTHLDLNVDEDTVNDINNVLKSSNVKDRVDEDWTIVYNGKVSDVPAGYVDLIAQNTTHVCIIIDGYQPGTVKPIVLSYNVQ